MKFRTRAAPILAATLLIGLSGCTTMEVARRGMANTGPVSGGVELDSEGNLKSVNIDIGPGTGRVVSVSRKTWHADGTPRSETILDSDPTIAQMRYFEGVRGQSAQSVANFQQVVTSSVNAASAMMAQLNQQYALLRETQAAYAPPPGEPSLRDEIRSLFRDLADELRQQAQSGAGVRPPAD